MAISPIFRDIELQNEFDRNGFVKVAVFSESQVNEFKNFYQNNIIKDSKNYGFNVSIDELNDELRKKYNNFYKTQVFPAFENLLINPKFFTGSFMIKEPIPTGTVAAHQDWTFVDENKYYSLMCWISLDNVSIENGAMAFLNGSNKYFSQIRGFPCPLVPEPVEKYRYKLMPYMNVVDTKKGEVLFFDNKTIHGSYPNTSNETRHGISLTLTQQDADFYAYYLKPNSKNILVKYKVSDDFFDKYNNPKFHDFYNKNQLLDDLESVEEIELIPQSMDWNELSVCLIKSENYLNKENDLRFGTLMNEQEKSHLESLRKLRKRNGILDRIKDFIAI